MLETGKSFKLAQCLLRLIDKKSLGKYIKLVPVFVAFQYAAFRNKDLSVEDKKCGVARLRGVDFHRGFRCILPYSVN